MANISLLLFNDAPSGLNAMKFFSVRQSWHFLVEGSNVIAPGRISHVMLYLICLSLSVQIYSLIVVTCLSVSVKSEMCWKCLFLNVPPVSPVYVSVVSSLFTVALCITSSFWQSINVASSHCVPLNFNLDAR